jgi:hypothetical protein
MSLSGFIFLSVIIFSSRYPKHNDRLTLLAITIFVGAQEHTLGGIALWM